jgi:3-oxoacyl-[acyl-carrier protein] reductase
MGHREIIHMQKILKGKTALVTGASRGLGLAIALALGQAGADVALTDILLEGQDHDTEKLERYSVLAGHFAQQGGVKTQAGAQEIQSLGSRSCAFKMDVADMDEVGRVVQAIEAGAKMFGGNLGRLLGIDTTKRRIRKAK